MSQRSAAALAALAGAAGLCAWRWYREARRLRRLVAAAALPLRQIGVVRSCYRDVQGTPRQPLLAPTARAVCVLDKAVVEACALEGLDRHSHVWLLFAFHENTNGRKRAVAAKVRPPRGRGRKVGCLATRTPHRPSALGLSLVALESVDARARRVVVRGADVVDGSPLVDIKPFLPSYDAPPAGDAVRTPLADWYGGDAAAPRAVRGAAGRLDAVADGLTVFAGDAAAATRALVETLAVDVSRPPRDKPYRTRFDGVLVEYVVGDSRVDVVAATRAAPPAPAAAAPAPATPPPAYEPPVDAATFARVHLRAPFAPLRLAGAAREWPAAAAWTLDGLADRCGERRVLVRQRVTSAAYRRGAASPVERMRFRRYVDELRAGRVDAYMAAARRGVFLFSRRETKERPSRRRRACATASPRSRRTFACLGFFAPAASTRGRSFGSRPKGTSSSATWTPTTAGSRSSRAGSGSAAASSSPFLPARGAHSPRRHATHGRPPQVELWPPTLREEMAPNDLGADGRTVQSSAPGPEPAAVFELGAGDALFIPAFSWHRVTSPEQSISLNFFFGDDDGYVSKVLDRPTFRLWLLNVLEQNAAGLPLILDHLDAAVSLLLKQQWADAATRRELDAIRDFVYDHLEERRPGAVAPGDRDARGRGDAGAAPPPGARLKIRGLRNRGGVDFVEDRERGQ